MRIAVLAAVAALALAITGRVAAGVDGDQDGLDHGHGLLAEEPHDRDHATRSNGRTTTPRTTRWSPTTAASSRPRSRPARPTRTRSTRPARSTTTTPSTRALTGKIIVNGPAARDHDRRRGADPRLRPVDAHLGRRLERQGRGDGDRLRAAVRPGFAGADRNAPDGDRRRLGRRRQADAAHDLRGALEEHRSASRSASSCGRPSVVFGANEAHGAR